MFVIKIFNGLKKFINIEIKAINIVPFRYNNESLFSSWFKQTVKKYPYPITFANAKNVNKKFCRKSIT